MVEMKEDIIGIVRKEVDLAIKALDLVRDRIDTNIEKAVELVYNCTGKTVVTGMGKTGIIGRKIAATLASTGSSSIFLHPAEGIHGDLGILNSEDLVLIVSYSGNTEEIIKIIPYIKFLHVPIIAITGNLKSQLASHADVVLDCSIPDDSEPFNLVPTVSTTVALVLGDALAVALLKKRNFQIQDFARFHPGGTIGKKLLLKVGDLMHTGHKNPLVYADDLMRTVLPVMTEKGLGCATVINKDGKLLGIITDGDLRRLLSQTGNPLDKSAFESMTKNPKTVSSDMLAVKALTIMEEYKITMLPVVNPDYSPIGMLHMHDLIDAGVVG